MKKIYSIKKIITRQNCAIAASMVIAFGIILTVLFFKKEQTQASVGLPFGGTINDAEYCCDGSIYLVVGTPRPGAVIFSPYISRLYKYYEIFTPGPWVLGDAIPGGYCDLVDADCEGGVPGNTIIQVGTSV